MDENLLMRRSELKRKLLPLEWDKRLKQINDARETELKKYLLELENVEKEIASNSSQAV